MTMRLRPAGVLAALLVMTACTSEGAAEATEPPTTGTPTAESTASPEPTTTPGTTFVMKEPDDFGPGITVTTRPLAGRSVPTSAVCSRVIKLRRLAKPRS